MSAPDKSDNLEERSRGRGFPTALAIGLAVFGFLPIANWISAGHAAPWYSQVAQSWISGTGIVIGVIIVLIILSRRRILGFTCNLADVAGRWFERHPRRASLIIAAVAAGVYTIVAITVFDARPLFIDEIVQMYQARVYAAGHLVDRVGPFPEFFGALNVVSVGDHQFGQFPPGGPAHLTLGVLLGAPWLTMPIAGGATIYVFARIVRHVEIEAPVALGAILLLAFSPFMVFMAASHMNHVPTLLWIMVAWLACLRLTSTPVATRWWAFLLGLAIGIAATVRPVDALAMTAPAVACVVLTRCRRDALSAFLVAGGLMIPMALLLAYNKATTGSPFVFGYELLWGKNHSLGFHASPWGIAHTPARGVELISLYALRLQSYLFESPTPSLLPVIITLAVSTAVVRFDRMMFWAIALLAAAYFAYWHDGFYLGPRFFFVLTPLLALLAARAPRALGEMSRHRTVRQLAFFGLTISFLIGLSTGLPARARVYSHGLASSRYVLADSDSLDGRGLLVFVRESWGSQVLARLWGRQVERPAAEVLYRGIDTCVLDSAVAALEQQNVVGADARAALWPLLRDSMRVRASTLSPDETERMLIGASYSRRCLEQVAADHQGTALYPPLLVKQSNRIVFARDLGASNIRLTKQYPDRATYLLIAPEPGQSRYRLLPLVLPAPPSPTSE